MGRYLDLARDALSALNSAPVDHFKPADVSYPPYDINDRNDQRVPEDVASSSDIAPWTDPAVAEARRLDVLGRTATELNSQVGACDSARWVTGVALDRLPEQLQGLVCPREGWTPARWAEHLRGRASLCDDQHRTLAELYEQAATLLLGRRIPSGANDDVPLYDPVHTLDDLKDPCPAEALAAALSKSPKTIVDWCQERQYTRIPCFKIGNRWYHRPVEVKRWLKGIQSGQVEFRRKPRPGKGR